MKPVWKFVLLVAEAIISALKSAFGGKSSDSEK